MPTTQQRQRNPDRHRKATDILQYVVYFRPSDYPTKWVVRCWSIGPGRFQRGPVVAVTEDLELAREAIPDDLVNIGRMPHDDAVIFEVWT